MKCIKDKCPYYFEHDFYESCFICTLVEEIPSFKKYTHVECLIDKEIMLLKRELKTLDGLRGELFGSRMATKEELKNLED